MKKHLQKLLALTLAFVLVLGLLPVRGRGVEEKVYILDATTDAEAMASGTKADGDTLVLGTEGYFTLICAAKTKIDSSSKTFDDGYSGNQRINFQTATDVAKGMVPAIRIDDRNTDLKDIPVQANQEMTVTVPVAADGITKLSVSFAPDPE